MFYLTHPRHVARVLRSFDLDADTAARSPALDVSEDDKAYHVTVDMPGVAKEVVKGRVEGRRVSIETATDESTPSDGSRLLYRERRAARYARSFSLPVEIDPSQSSAHFENGVLTLNLVKRVAENGGQLTIN